MERRKLLASAGVAFIGPLAGCLQTDGLPGGTDTDDSEDNGNGSPDGGSNPDRKYEECHLVSIRYHRLPEDIQSEVDVALEDGVYEAERILFEEAVDSDRSYLVLEDTPYEPIIDSDEGKRSLEFEEVDAIRLPEPRTISFENDDSQEHEVSIVLTNGGTIIDTTITLEAGEERDIDATDEFGHYELTVEAMSGHGEADTFEFRVGDAYFDGYVQVDESGISITQTVADPAPCPWEE